MPKTFQIFAQFSKETFFCEIYLYFIFGYELFSTAGIGFNLKAYDILRIWLVP